VLIWDENQLMVWMELKHSKCVNKYNQFGQNIK